MAIFALFLAVLTAGFFAFSYALGWPPLETLSFVADLVFLVGGGLSFLAVNAYHYFIQPVGGAIIVALGAFFALLAHIAVFIYVFLIKIVPNEPLLIFPVALVILGLIGWLREALSSSSGMKRSIKPTNTREKFARDDHSLSNFAFDDDSKTGSNDPSSLESIQSDNLDQGR